MTKWILSAPAALALAACAATGADLPKPNDALPAMADHHNPHLVMVKSNNGFEQTLSRVQNAIESRGFKTFAVIDHAAGAASIGADLRPTTLVIFGKPKGGTPVIQAEQRMGLRLPLKVLVFEDAAGDVHVTYEDMTHLFHEYSISGLAGPLANIEGALAAIAAAN